MNFRKVNCDTYNVSYKGENYGKIVWCFEDGQWWYDANENFYLDAKDLVSIANKVNKLNKA